MAQQTHPAYELAERFSEALKVTRARILDLLDATLDPDKAAPAKRLADNSLDHLHQRVWGNANQIMEENTPAGN